MLNLACAGATIEAGLRGTQSGAGMTVPAQVGLLRQLRSPDWVVVAVGAELVLGTPAGGAGSAEAFTAFGRAYAALLADLAALPEPPAVVILTTYDVIASPADPACPELAAVPDPAALAERAELLDEVLERGVRSHDVVLARPALTPLCGSGGPPPGPDLQGPGDPHPFHPTGIGSVRIAAALNIALAQALELRR